MFTFGVVSTLVAVGALWYAYTQRAKVKAYAAVEEAKVIASLKGKI